MSVMTNHANSETGYKISSDKIKRIRELAPKLAEIKGGIRDGDTVLCDILQDTEPETGMAEDLFRIWDEGDRKTFSELFWLLTGIPFPDYLDKVIQIIEGQITEV